MFVAKDTNFLEDSKIFAFGSYPFGQKIDNSKCPIYLLTGEYDYSATPEETKSLADTIGIEMIEMKNVGHFPMSENPKEFLKYLHPVLNKIS